MKQEKIFNSLNNVYREVSQMLYRRGFVGVILSILGAENDFAYETMHRPPLRESCLYIVDELSKRGRDSLQKTIDTLTITDEEVFYAVIPVFQETFFLGVITAVLSPVNYPLENLEKTIPEIIIAAIESCNGLSTKPQKKSANSSGKH